MSQTYLKKDTRRDLWIRAGARCQFRGCNKPIDRNFLTQESVVIGTYCHIVGDSPDGPRGDLERSEALAADPANLILCCPSCHKTIDDSKLEAMYSEALLLEMKREHELHIQRLYDATGVKLSHPLVITGRIAGTPTSISVSHARNAVLQKSGYRRFPSHSEHVINLNNIAVAEEDQAYWTTAKKLIDNRLDNLMSIRDDSQIDHLDVFGLAQIPVLMYIGYLLGDRIPSTIHQAFRDQDNKWLWPATERPAATFSYRLPDTADLSELALSVSLSGIVRKEDVERAAPGLPLAKLEAEEKSPFVISSEADLAAFVATWRALLAEVHARYGHIRLHVFPAVPNSVAIEMGRCVHPKVMPRMKVWDYTGGAFIPTLEFGASQ